MVKTDTKRSQAQICVWFIHVGTTFYDKKNLTSQNLRRRKSIYNLEMEGGGDKNSNPNIIFL